MKTYYIDEGGRVSKLYDELVERKKIFPFWMMSNFRKDLGGSNFFCFLNCNYPDGIQSVDEKAWRGAYQFMNSKFLPGERAIEGNKDKRIGWGEGETPQKAFHSALRSSNMLQNPNPVLC